MINFLLKLFFPFASETHRLSIMCDHYEKKVADLKNQVDRAEEYYINAKSRLYLCSIYITPSRDKRQAESAYESAVKYFLDVNLQYRLAMDDYAFYLEAYNSQWKIQP